MADEELIKDLQAQIERGQVVVIVGAGVSMGATNGNHLASWAGLLEDGVNRCFEVVRPRLDDDWKELLLREIRSDDLDNLLSAATKVSSKLGAPEGGEYGRWLRETVGSLRAENREVIEALHRLDIQLATTNFDGLIEEVTGLAPVNWMEGAKVERVIRGDDRGVLHLHGYWDKPESVILGIRSYEQVMSDAHAQNVLRALQAMKTLFFVGFGTGLKDPNFAAFLRWTGDVFRQSEYRRFRLGKDDEVEALQREHPPEQRLFVLSFGKEHSDLARFLRNLRPYISQSASSPVLERKWAMIPPAPRCFGRDREVNNLVGLLLTENPPPIPIIGPPGIGKTTISLAALHDPQVTEKYGARRCFIRCDGIKTSEALAAQIGLGLGLQPSPAIETAVLSALSADRTVLVIDNTETPWEADPLRVEEFLGQIAGIPCVALVVSVQGNERPSGVNWRESIQPLPLSRQAACDTFLAIAGQKYKDDVHLDTLLAAIDYVPLAVTLMAHAAEAEPNLDGIWKRWQQERTEMLRRADGKERLTNIEISYEISIEGSRMTDESRRLLALLGYLPNGVVLEELESIFPVDCNRAASVLRKTGLAFDESGRLRVLTPLREYMLRKHPPDPNDLKRVVSFYANLVIAEGARLGSNEGSKAVARMAPQVANIEGAILQGLQSSDPEAAVEAALAFANFTKLTGLGSSRLLGNAASVAEELGNTQTAAHCIKSLGEIAFARSDHDAARTRFEVALSLYRELGYVRGEANCILGMGEIALARSDHDAARARFEDALPLYQQEKDMLGEANCIFDLGNIALARSDHDVALARFEEAQSLYRQVGLAFGEANCVSGLGEIALARSQHDIARVRFEEALPLCRQVGNVRGEANCFFNLARIASARSQYNHARARLEEALPLYRQVGYVAGEANCIFSLGDISLEHSQYNEAQARFEEALPLYRRVGDLLGEANCISNLGTIAFRQSRLDDARARTEEALPLFQRAGGAPGIAHCMKSLGEIALRLSLYDDARTHFDEALGLYRQVGDVRGEANCIFHLGRISLIRSQYDDARERFQEALPLYRQVGYVVGEANCIRGLGEIALGLSVYDDARTRFVEALLLYRQVGDVLGEANCIMSQGEISLRLSLYGDAQARLDEALPLYRQMGDTLGAANCILNLGNVARGRSENDIARTNYEEALPLYQEAGDARGEANCIKNLGFIALACSDRETARARFTAALKIYEQISEAYSVGMTHRALAHLAFDADERKSHVIAARVAFEEIRRDDLIAQLLSEFGDIS